MMAGQPAWRGKSEITEKGAQMFGAVKFADVKFTTSTVDVTGDYAIETGTYAMTVTETGKKPVPDKGKYLTVWKKQADGTWKVYRDITNTDLPPN
jgi:ketosteroid isomerase-like protein